MRPRYIASLILMVVLLAGCGQPAVVQTPAQPTERPTALMLETAVPTDAPTATNAPAPTAVAPTLVPTSTRRPEPPAEAATATPTAAPSSTVVATLTTAEQKPTERAPNVIVIDSPQPNASISSPLAISGSANFWPFEATLAVELKDAAGNPLAQMPVMVQSPDIGQGGPWSGEMNFTPPASAQEGTLEVIDYSAKDGSILTIASVKVRLAPAPAPGTSLEFDQPAEGSLVTMPLRIALTGARGDEALVVRLLQNGVSVVDENVRAELGFVVASIIGQAHPGAATLEIARPDGTVLERRALQIAAPDETQTVRVAWSTGAEGVTLEERHVPRTPQVASAALNELLWGPDQGTNQFGTALPTPSEVLAYSGREAGWGPRVKLLKLTITDGVALANFSPEMRAYGGGSERATMIRTQIETTLRQFPSVREVVIAVDGQTEGVLEP